MYELAWKMSRDNNDLLWWAIIGHTEQLLYEKIDRWLHVVVVHSSCIDFCPMSNNSSVLHEIA